MAEKMKDRLSEYKQDIVKFAEKEFCLVETKKPIALQPHQKRILTDVFTVDDKGKFPYETIIYSSPKKSGKTTVGALVSVWWSLSQESDNEIKIVANDLEQSVSRVFKVTRKAFELNPNLKRSASITAKQIVLTNGTEIDALSCDYAGEAGANQGLTVWDELWGYTSENARRLWDELTPVPTRLNSIRFICTYAGWENESELLWELYQRGLKGKKIHDDLPVYVNGDLYMYWDHEARMPWQTRHYYKKQRAALRVNTYLRLHENKWTSNEDSLFDMDEWDACVDEDHRPLLPTKAIRLSVGVDASIKGDSSGVVATYYDKEKGKVVLALHRKWQPSRKDPIDLEETIEKYLLYLHENYRLHVVRYDPWQFQRSSVTLKKKGLPIEEFTQSPGNLTEMGQNMFDLVKHGNIILYKDSDMRNHARDCIGKETARGWKITKEKSSHKVDLIVALAMSALSSVQSGGASTIKADGIKSFDSEFAGDSWDDDEVFTRRRRGGETLSSQSDWDF